MKITHLVDLPAISVLALLIATPAGARKKDGAANGKRLPCTEQYT